ncbi:MAG: ggt [Caulobacteraceae bacterium]|nr:ggt [Caulobacteraceae bacterium]
MRPLLPLVLILAGLGLCAAAPDTAKPPATAQHAMVSAANPMAAEAGLKVLKAGGSAADAAVAIQAVLGLVEPQSSGLGGGGFITYYDAATRTVTAYDGREAAPAGATPDLLMQDGRPMPMQAAVLSGKSTGPPGAMAALAMAQKDHGKQPWSSLFDDAARLASDGFPTPRRLAMYAAQTPKSPEMAAYVTKPDGTRWQVGDVIKNPAYAASIRKIATEGVSALYTGSIAADIAAKVAEPLAGTLKASDLAAYQAQKTPALCRPYRVYVVCVPPPPSSGLAILQGLMMLEHTDIATRGPTDPVAWAELSQAEQLLYADRDLYVGDPKFANVPIEGMLDPAYVASRAALISQKAGPAPAAGKPPGAPLAMADYTQERAGTSHFVVVDEAGNVLSMTTSVESPFGSGRYVDGFFINNQLTDFSFTPTDAAGHPVANAVAAGKRPRSSMSPVIVLDKDGGFVLALGSPGGNSILAYNFKALVALLDWKMPVQQALDLPNLIARGAPSGETTRFGPDMVAKLAEQGVTLRNAAGEDSGLHAVMKKNGVLEGGADSRREGEAIGY